MLVMYDSVTVADLPTGGDCYAAYANGTYQNLAAVRARFPGKPVFDIAVRASFDATCLDIEKGDATPDQAPAWVKRQLAHGVDRPVVYSSQSQMPQVLTVLAAAGIARGQVRIWSAHYSPKYGRHLCSPAACNAAFTADATQWSDVGTQGNGHYDTSLLADDFLENPVALDDNDKAWLQQWTTALMRTPEWAGIIQVACAKAVADATPGIVAAVAAKVPAASGQNSFALTGTLTPAVSK